MRHESNDTSSLTTDAIPGAGRPAQIARENQAGFNDVRLINAETLVGLMLPAMRIEGTLVPVLKASLPEENQISDCSKENCTVGGVRYANSADIPGNHPKLLLQRDGKPVIGPDGKPVFGPDGVDLEKIAQQAKAHQNVLTIPSSVFKFRHSGEWDFQRRMTDNIPGQGVRPIFTREFQNFANIGVGYILGSLGASLNDIGTYSDTYCWARGCDYKEQRAKDFPHIAERQWEDYQIGIKLWNERHPRITSDGK